MALRRKHSQSGARVQRKAALTPSAGAAGTRQALFPAAGARRIVVVLPRARQSEVPPHLGPSPQNVPRETTLLQLWSWQTYQAERPAAWPQPTETPPGQHRVLIRDKQVRGSAHRTWVRLLAPISWQECWIPAIRYGMNLWIEPLSCTAPETPWATLILSVSLHGSKMEKVCEADGPQKLALLPQSTIAHLK